MMTKIDFKNILSEQSTIIKKYIKGFQYGLSLGIIFWVFINLFLMIK